MKKQDRQVILVMILESVGLEKYLGMIYDGFGIFPNDLGFLSCQVVDQKGHFNRREYFDFIKWNVLRITGSKRALTFLDK